MSSEGEVAPEHQESLPGGSCGARPGSARPVLCPGRCTIRRRLLTIRSCTRGRKRHVMRRMYPPANPEELREFHTWQGDRIRREAAVRDEGRDVAQGSLREKSVYWGWAEVSISCDIGQYTRVAFSTGRGRS